MIQRLFSTGAVGGSIKHENLPGYCFRYQLFFFRIDSEGQVKYKH